MSLVINTNISSINSQRQLGKSQSALASAMQRLSSGLRVNSAKDDAAGIGIASRMTTQVRGLDQAIRNANNTISVIQTMEGGMDEIHNMLQRMRELSVQSSDDSNASTDRTALNSEFTALRSEIDRIARTTTFNGQNVLNGGMGSTVGNLGASLTAANGIEDISSSGAGAATYTLTVAAGSVSGKKYTLSDGTNSQVVDNVGVPTGLNSTEVNFSGMGVKLTVNAQIQNIGAANTFEVTAGSGTFQVGSQNGAYERITMSAIDVRSSAFAGLDAADITSRSNANAAIDTVQTAINTVLTNKGGLGALNNRLDYTVANLANVVENTTAARSRVLDADFAAETANMTKNSVLQQAGVAMLAQANALPQQILTLLRG